MFKTPSRSHDCYCDTFSGFVRHPNGSCVVMADCPDGSMFNCLFLQMLLILGQRHCADFEELVLFGAMEATCNQVGTEAWNAWKFFSEHSFVDNQ